MSEVHVQQAFNRAAAKYQTLCYGANTATLQQQAAQLLLQQTLAAHKQPAKQLLDLGCGSGVHWPKLHTLSKNYLGVDLSPAMIGQARKRYGMPAGTHWLVGDAQALPLPNSVTDLVFSNLALQWCPQPEQVAAELFRVCKPGGRIHVSTLIQGSLVELKHLQQLGLLTRVNRYPRAAQWQQALQQAGFQQVLVEQTQITTHHDSAANLLRSMKAIGASRVLQCS
ncbi:malonyl-[acyl-carrier protein] O-methyltransferase BioC [Aliidiomarina taiwanensis]|uniref:Malonyl-[acyl-carrier protein] O-methyltransferase BioC n=1 Tax=Aliidiomarina taiwanensis TaxID=946228 RepID=A0A432XA01_9GAMM|nr:methyltransferase domain-containing protein [Aliidiomarina taiwanensis]RUO44189.1 malonyl-[acyl-carrier protein] O-methyltransferase BioC [Aliidiomarina taiwanensis]